MSSCTISETRASADPLAPDLALTRHRRHPHSWRAHTLGLLLCLLSVASVRADDWPQWLGPHRDGIWRETGILETFPAGGPKYRWRTPIGAGYSGPAVAGDRVFVTDRVLAEGTNNPTNPFSRNAVEGSERVLCLDAATGKILWKYEYSCPYRVSYAAGPRATPAISDGHVYALGAMGDLVCLDAENGKVSWSKNLPKEYQAKVPMWGYSAHPLVDGDKLICLAGGQGSAVVALRKSTGEELWRALSADDIGYCPPVIVEAGGRRQLIVWHPEAVNGLDPETGRVAWSQKFAVKAGMTIATPRQDGLMLFVSCFYNGSMMLRLAEDLSTANVVWKGKSNREMPKQTDGLHSVMATPALKDGYIYGICSYGELRCLKADTGERIWKTMQATTGGPEERWSHAFLVAQGDRFFLFNEKGDLIMARLTPKGYEEISRAHILDPTNRMVANQRNQKQSVLWSHPAFAHQAVYARNDNEIVCVDLKAEPK
jgi:outer membrane protein assembly factor BamB